MNSPIVVTSALFVHAASVVQGGGVVVPVFLLRFLDTCINGGSEPHVNQSGYDK